jgi:glycosyltransferase involved in cell wall biosynthesis
VKLESNKASILLLTRYGRNGASSRVRCCNYISALQGAGFSVTKASFFDDDYLVKLYNGKQYDWLHLIRDYARRLQRLLTATSYDIIWIEKEVLPWVPTWVERALLGGRPFVIDYDDAWHLRYAEHQNFAIRNLLPRKLESIVEKATAVVVGNPVIADWALASGAHHVIEIPTVVDLKHYPIKPLPDEPFTIGWIGTPITQKYLQIIAEPLRYVQKNFKAQIRLIGASPGFSIAGVDVDVIPWAEKTEADELSRCHVGIMPLSDAAWEQGKCGYKLVQYMASARPTVASPVGFNRKLVVNNETGFLAQAKDDWIEALSTLAMNQELLKRFGKAGRRRAEEEFCVDVFAPKLVRVFTDLLPETFRLSNDEGAVINPVWSS